MERDSKGRSLKKVLKKPKRNQKKEGEDVIVKDDSWPKETKISMKFFFRGQ